MIAFICAALAGLGMYFLYSALAYNQRIIHFPPRESAKKLKGHCEEWLTQAGLGDIGLLEFVAVLTVVTFAGGLIGVIVFASAIPALATAAVAGTIPITRHRVRRSRRQDLSNESWPRIIEEIRLLTASAGLSIPQALFEAGRNAPTEMGYAFSEAEREWLLTTNFERTVAVLKSKLANPTADATCETLLIAHRIGGSELASRLEALIEDRVLDIHGRKDAHAKQAGARFARRFVLIVPAGMAVVGLSIGNGRRAYQAVTGQILVTVGLCVLAACWVWAGHLLRLPEEERVFRS